MFLGMMDFLIIMVIVALASQLAANFTMKQSGNMSSTDITLRGGEVDIIRTKGIEAEEARTQFIILREVNIKVDIMMIWTMNIECQFTTDTLGFS